MLTLFVYALLAVDSYLFENYLLLLISYSATSSIVHVSKAQKKNLR